MLTDTELASALATDTQPLRDTVGSPVDGQHTSTGGLSLPGCV